MKRVILRAPALIFCLVLVPGLAFAQAPPRNPSLPEAGRSTDFFVSVLIRLLLIRIKR